MMNSAAVATEAPGQVNMATLLRFGWEVSNISAVYEETDIHEHRQITGPTSGYPGIQPQSREPDDYDMDDYNRQAQSQRSLFPVTIPPDYTQSYPATSAAFPSAPMTAPQDYMIGRGPAPGYGSVQVPRSHYEYNAVAPGRSESLQSPNQGQFASQAGMQAPGPYQDPRTGQIIYPLPRQDVASINLRGTPMPARDVADEHDPSSNLT